MWNDFVWFSYSLLRSNYIYGVEQDEISFTLDRFISATRSNEKGQKLAASELPSKLFLKTGKRFKTQLPLLNLGGILAVTYDLANVLKDFDLGQSALYPVDLLKSDRKTPVDVPVFFFNLCEHKSAFAPERSMGVERTYNDDRDNWTPRGVIPPDGLAVTPDALIGPDVWLDPRLRLGFFLSDRLVKALKAAKLDKPLILHRCRVLLPN